MTQEGLRARRKRAVENAIELAAVELAVARGHRAVTVADICARADVSRSTFFNYMATREAAIFGRPVHLAPAEEISRFLDDTSVPLTTAMYRAIFASIGHIAVNAGVATGRTRLMELEPDTAPMVMAPFLSLTTELTAALTPWLARHPERRQLPGIPLPREASLMVLLTVSAMHALISEVSGTGDIHTTEEMFTDALAAIAHLAANS